MKTLFLALALATTQMQASLDSILWELNFRTFELHCDYQGAQLEDRQRIIGKIEGFFEAIELIEQDMLCD